MIEFLRMKLIGEELLLINGKNKWLTNIESKYEEDAIYTHCWGNKEFRIFHKCCSISGQLWLYIWKFCCVQKSYQVVSYVMWRETTFDAVIFIFVPFWKIVIDTLTFISCWGASNYFLFESEACTMKRNAHLRF